MSDSQNSADHYAGSIEYDSDQGAWTDSLVTAIDYDYFIELMKDLQKKRREGRVFFAVHMVNGEEHDIKARVERDIRCR